MLESNIIMGVFLACAIGIIGFMYQWDKAKEKVKEKEENSPCTIEYKEKNSDKLISTEAKGHSFNNGMCQIIKNDDSKILIEKDRVFKIKFH